MAFSTPISLEKLSKYLIFIKLINESNDQKHDPVIDASVKLELYNLIPEEVRHYCKLNFDSYLKVLENYNKQKRKLNNIQTIRIVTRTLRNLFK